MQSNRDIEWAKKQLKMQELEAKGEGAQDDDHERAGVDYDREGAN